MRGKGQSQHLINLWCQSRSEVGVGVTYIVVHIYEVVRTRNGGQVVIALRSLRGGDLVGVGLPSIGEQSEHEIAYTYAIPQNKCGEHDRDMQLQIMSKAVLALSQKQ